MSLTSGGAPGGNPPRVSRRALWVVLGCLICQMGLGYGYVLGPIAGFLLEDFGWSRAAYSSARAPQLFVIAAISPIIGTLAVRLGARAVLATGAVMLGAALLLFSVLQELWQLYLLVMLLGVAITALGDIAVGQLVTRWIDRGRGLALGIVYTGSNLGGWLIVPFAVDVASRESWRISFAYLGASALLVLLPAALLLVREPVSVRPRDDTGADERVEHRSDEHDLDLAAALGTRSFWILFGALFSFFFFFLGVLDFLVLFLTDSGLSKQEASLYFSHGLGIGIAAKLILGATADRIPHKSALLLDYGLLALSSLLLIALPEAAPIWGFVICFAFATAARDVVYPLVIADCFGPRFMAQIYGALMLALLPGGSLGPIFAAAVHDRTGDYQIAFYCFAVLNLLALGALCGIRREHRPSPG